MRHFLVMVAFLVAAVLFAWAGDGSGRKPVTSSVPAPPRTVAPWTTAPAPRPVASSPGPELPGPAAGLTKRGAFSGIDDPKTTLQEALDHLFKVYNVPLDVNEEAFAAASIKDVTQTPIAEKPIPKMSDVTLSTVLHKILAELSRKHNVPATWMVRRDAIEITTVLAQDQEIWGDYKGPHLPLINVAFQDRPLSEALRDLSDQADLSVVLDGRVGDKAKTPVTARLLNTPIDTAVRLLADMAGLKHFLVDNVIYVTTPDNIDRLEGKRTGGGLTLWPGGLDGLGGISGRPLGGSPAASRGGFGIGFGLGAFHLGGFGPSEGKGMGGPGVAPATGEEPAPPRIGKGRRAFSNPEGPPGG